MKEHVDEEHSHSDIECTECGIYYASKQELVDHVKATHTGDKVDQEMLKLANLLDGLNTFEPENKSKEFEGTLKAKNKKSKHVRRNANKKTKADNKPVVRPVENTEQLEIESDTEGSDTEIDSSDTESSLSTEDNTQKVKIGK